MKKILTICTFILFSVLVYFALENSFRNVSLEFEEVSMGDSTSSEKLYYSKTSLDYLKSLNIDSNAPKIEQELSSGSNYKRYIASYLSGGNKIYGLLTIPNETPPQGGYPAIVFNHGYIPPRQYNTTEKYVAYVDNLAKNGFVVFKIDLRGHGNSEGTAGGSYFSPGYTIDAISALKSLQKHSSVNAKRIGMWGHSMAGNLVLRAMLVEPQIKAGVIWAGAVFSYEDFAKYRLNDGSYVRPKEIETPSSTEGNNSDREDSKEVRALRNNEEIDFSTPYWKSISLTQNINYLNAPVQLHHSIDDPVVSIGYSYDLAKVLKDNNKSYELFEYEGGGHNINSPYFEPAIQRTVEFFKKNL